MSRLTKIADAVKDCLHETTFEYNASSIGIGRAWLPYLKREEIGDGKEGTDRIARLNVVPNSEEVTAQVSRTKAEHLLTVDVFVQRAVEYEGGNTEIDEAMDLAEEVLDAVEAMESFEVDGLRASPLAANFDPAIIGEHLLEYRIYTGRIVSRWKMFVET